MIDSEDREHAARDNSNALRAKLQPIPEVRCTVRARIPTTTGHETFLHLYHNDIDKKEHLAIVFGNQIRSKSLDAVRPGETEMDRMIRGAYTGRLFPGRTSSQVPLAPLGHPKAEQHFGDKINSASESNLKSRGVSTSASVTNKSEALPHDSPSDHNEEVPFVRIHSECYTGETIGSSRCDCGDQLNDAAAVIAAAPNPVGGIIVYLRQEGRGIGLLEKLKAYNLQDLGSDTVEANLILHHPADARDYGLATSILLDLGCNAIKLLTNNPLKITAVEGPNREVKVVERVAMVPRAWRGEKGVDSEEARVYLSTKIQKMGHLLSQPKATR